MLSLRVCMNLGMLVFLLVSRDTLFCIGKEMERSTVTLRGTARGRRASRFLWLKARIGLVEDHSVVGLAWVVARRVCDAICQEWYPLFESHFLFGTILDDF